VPNKHLYHFSAVWDSILAVTTLDTYASCTTSEEDYKKSNNWPCAVCATHVTIWVHSISRKIKPRFLVSPLNLKNFESTFCHCGESARHQSILSLILQSECHIKLFTYFALLKMHLNFCITKKYHKTLVWILFLFFCTNPHYKLDRSSNLHNLFGT